MRNTRFLLSAVAVLASAAYSTTPARADSLGVDFNSTPPTYSTNINDWNLGWSFTVVNPVTVIGLGNADVFGNGFNGAGTQQVGLWDSNGNLLASTLVSPSDSRAGVGGGYWLFSAITPITLTPGDTYIVGGQGGAQYSFSPPYSPVTVDPDITFDTNLYTFTGNTANMPLVRPTTSDPNITGYFGGNVEFASNVTPTPEPAGVVGILGLGGMCLLGLVWRRRRS